MSTRKRSCLLLLLALTLVRGLIYAAIIPPWQAPDETGHFEYSWLLASLGRLPRSEDLSSGFEREQLASLYEWRYGEFIGHPLPWQMPARMDDLPQSVFAQRSRPVLLERPSLSYLWSALSLLPFRHHDLAFQLYAARLSQVLLNMSIVWLAYLTFTELLPSRHKLVALMTTLVVFLPQHTFVNSTVGDGPLAEAMACLVLYCWARLFGRGFGAWEAAGVVLGTLVAVWSKTTATYLIPADAGLALWFFLRQSGRTWTRQEVIWFCAGVAVLGTGIWLWSTTPLGATSLRSAQSLSSPAQWAWVDERGVTLGSALLRSYDSFWANFGWMAVPVGERWYGAIALLSVAALTGWVTGKPDREIRPWTVGLMGATALVAWVVFVWAALLSREGSYYQFQGRYLFPIVIPYAFLLVGGLQRLLPTHLNRCVMALFLLSLIYFDGLCLTGYIIPYFY